MKFRVSIGYYDFDFTDAAKALYFAKTARKSLLDEDLIVVIELIKIEEPEPALNEDEEDAHIVGQCFNPD